MQNQPKAEQFDIEEARRVLGDVFAPWVQDLGLSIGSIESAPPPGAAADWQPGAVLRMAFSERLCRHGGIVCGQALMALADTSMVIAILAANRGYRPMTTVDQTTHFMRAVTQSDVLADARVVRLGRTMSFGRVTLSSAADNKPVAMVSSAFAMLQACRRRRACREPSLTKAESGIKYSGHSIQLPVIPDCYPEPERSALFGIRGDEREANGGQTQSAQTRHPRLQRWRRRRLHGPEPFLWWRAARCRQSRRPAAILHAGDPDRSVHAALPSGLEQRHPDRRRVRLERFRAKHAFGLDPGVDTGSREENASRQKSVVNQSGSVAVRHFQDRFQRLLMVQTEKIGDNPRIPNRPWDTIGGCCGSLFIWR
jgi:uncharacterized protein (TIGR00369 family)